MNDHDLDQLRRVAFGRTSSADERAAAAEALRRLGEDAAQHAAETAEPESLAGTPAADPTDDESEPIDETGRLSRIRPLWLVPIVLASVAVGAIGALVVSSQLGGAPSPVRPVESHTPAVPLPNLSGGPGDLEAADRWFIGGATPSDAYPHPGLLESNDIDPYDVRFVLSEGIEWNVWIGRSRTGDLCLLVTDGRDQTGAGGCVAREQFARAGIRMAMGGHWARWNGDTVFTDRSLLGQGDSSPIAILPPGAAPGDIEAAQAWFADAATPTDPFPYPDALAELGIDPDDVRSVGIPDPGWALWVARQGVTGYCLVATTNLKDAVFSACSTIDQFRESGVSLVAQGHSAQWNGESVTSG